MTQDYLTMPLSGQLASCIETLQNIIEFADDKVWTLGEPPFWQIVFHTISSLDLYMSTFNKNVDKPDEQYQYPSDLEKYGKFSHYDNDPIELNEIEPISKSDLAKFLQSTRMRIKEAVNLGIHDQLQEISGIPWLPFTKFELILHVIRHTAGHNGTLNQVLKSNGLKYQGWLGRKEL